MKMAMQPDYNEMIDGENDADDNGWNKITDLALDFLKLLAESDHEGLTSEV